MTTEKKGTDRQVGGDHYRRFQIEPVEYIVANKLGFLAGNIIKYATRYPYKNGAEDIRKIIHYCELILEFEYGEVDAAPLTEDQKSALDELAKTENAYAYVPCDRYGNLSPEQSLKEQGFYVCHRGYTHVIGAPCPGHL